LSTFLLLIIQHTDLFLATKIVVQGFFLFLILLVTRICIPDHFYLFFANKKNKISSLGKGLDIQCSALVLNFNILFLNGYLFRAEQFNEFHASANTQMLADILTDDPQTRKQT
jgi:hypothetical protein